MRANVLAVDGGAAGNGADVTVGSQSRSEYVIMRKDTHPHGDENYNEHHDNGRHLGQHKNTHMHDD